MKLNCAHAGTMLPDYWQGSGFAHVAVSVWPTMTTSQLRDAICHELRYGYVMGGTEIARLLSADLVAPQDEKRADRLTRAAYAAVRRDVRSRQRRPFRDLPEDSESYAYFIFNED